MINYENEIIANQDLAQMYSSTETIVDIPGEEWKFIDGFSFYMVSNKGRIKKVAHNKPIIRCLDGKVLKFKHIPEKLIKQTVYNEHLMSWLIDDNGKKHRLFVHVLVIKAFVPNPLNLPWAFFKDDNKLNTCAENLGWHKLTLSEEQRAAISQARKKRTSKSKPLIMDGDHGENVFFPSVADAARELTVNRQTLENWLDNPSKMPDIYKSKRLRYYTPSKIEITAKSSK